MAEEKRAGGCDRQWKHQLIKCELKCVNVMVKIYHRQGLYTLSLYCTRENNLDGAGSAHT